jgi:hypothetical protein
MAWLERHDPGRAAAARRLANHAVSVETAFTLDRALPAHALARGAVSVSRLRFAHGSFVRLLGTRPVTVRIDLDARS